MKEKVAAIRPRDVAAGMELSEREFSRFLQTLEANFFEPRHVRKGGKVRLIDAPYGQAKIRLRLLHDWIQRKRLYHKAAHGGVCHRSPFTSACIHLGKPYVWKRDVANCFPSVGPDLLNSELLELGFNEDTACVLTSLFIVRERIPQGSPVSNDAVNLLFYRLDQHLSSFCGSHGLAFSHLTDDFVISGKNRSHGSKAARLVEEGINALGLKISRRKKLREGFQCRSQSQVVHAIDVSPKRGTKISRKHRKEVAALVDSYLASCRSITPCALEAVATKRRRLEGWLHYCRQAHTGPERHIRTQLRNGDRLVTARLKEIGLCCQNDKWWIMNRTRNVPRALARKWERNLLVDVRVA